MLKKFFLVSLMMKDNDAVIISEIKKPTTDIIKLLFKKSPSHSMENYSLDKQKTPFKNINLAGLFLNYGIEKD